MAKLAFSLLCAGTLAVACGGEAGKAAPKGPGPGPDPSASPAGRPSSRSASSCDDVPRVARVLAEDLDFRPGDDRVRFVRYHDCKLFWLDDCQARTPIAYGPAVPVGLPRTTNLVANDEADLARVAPRLALLFSRAFERGATLSLEARTTATRVPSRVPKREDLPGSSTCLSATHVVTELECGTGKLRARFPKGQDVPMEFGDDQICRAPVAVTIEAF